MKYAAGLFFYILYRKFIISTGHTKLSSLCSKNIYTFSLITCSSLYLYYRKDKETSLKCRLLLTLHEFIIYNFRLIFLYITYIKMTWYSFPATWYSLSILDGPLLCALPIKKPSARHMVDCKSKTFWAFLLRTSQLWMGTSVRTGGNEFSTRG